MTTAYKSPWASYQTQIYGYRQAPAFTTSLSALEALVKEKLPRGPFWYVAGSAGEARTAKGNVDAFEAWKIIPRMLVDTNVRDLRTTLFGVQHSSPLLIGPVGVCGIFHEDGEEAVARAAKTLGVHTVQSTAATRSIETFARENGEGGQRWYQLYWPITEEVTLSLLSRARTNGFTALVVTLDTTLLGHRPNDLDTAYLPFLDGLGCQVGFSDPVFCARLGVKPCESLSEWTPEDIKRCSMAWLGEVNSGVFRTWKDLAFIRKNWDGPIILKGIMCVEDALLAQEAGMDGIIVSNHGGRQIDGCLSSLDALVDICADERVCPKESTSSSSQSSAAPPSLRHPSRKMAVLFDSGIRSGSDVIKALAIGADAVLLGRPWVYGLALGGEKGVEQVVRTILSEADVSLGLMGKKSVAELSMKDLRKVI
ncbi:hypothetical protein RQP46_009710 [Phenoliferia psychrophenolica]